MYKKDNITLIQTAKMYFNMLDLKDTLRIEVNVKLYLSHYLLQSACEYSTLCLSLHAN